MPKLNETYERPFRELFQIILKHRSKIHDLEKDHLSELISNRLKGGMKNPKKLIKGPVKKTKKEYVIKDFPGIDKRFAENLLFSFHKNRRSTQVKTTTLKRGGSPEKNFNELIFRLDGNSLSDHKNIILGLQNENVNLKKQLGNVYWFAVLIKY